MKIFLYQFIINSKSLLLNFIITIIVLLGLWFSNGLKEEDGETDVKN